MYVCVQDSSYTHAKQYTYREQGVKVSRSAQLGEGVVLGQGTVVHDDAILRRAIVGRGSPCCPFVSFFLLLKTVCI